MHKKYSTNLKTALLEGGNSATTASVAKVHGQCKKVHHLSAWKPFVLKNVLFVLGGVSVYFSDMLYFSIY